MEHSKHKAHDKSKIDLYTFNSLSDYKDRVNSYRLKKDSQWNNEENIKKSLHHWENPYKCNGTKQQCQQLTSFQQPDKLQKVREEIQADVQQLQVTDVRKRVQFHKNKHVFCAERYHNGMQRKAFATRKGKRAPRPVVNIGLSIGYNANTSANAAIYNCLGGIIFADMLAKSGYAVNVYAFEVATGMNGNHTQTNVIKVKDSSTYMDTDTLAIIASDPRFFRYWGFQQNIINEDSQGRKAPNGLGHAPNLKTTKKYLADAGYEFDFTFGKCFDHTETVKQVKKAVRDLQRDIDQQAA